MPSPNRRSEVGPPEGGRGTPAARKPDRLKEKGRALGRDIIALSRRTRTNVHGFGRRFTGRAAIDDPAEDTTRIRWARELWEAELWEAIRPFSTGGVYANNLGEEERSALKQPMVRITRLHALKNKCDPTNFFRLNQNITPARG